MTTSNILFSDRRNGDGLLNQTIEKFPSGSTCPSVEAKGKFVQIIIQVRGTNRSLMCPLQPSFQQRSDQVHQRQQIFSNISRNADSNMPITCIRQWCVTGPAICAYYTSRDYALLYSWYQTCSRGILYSSKAYSPNVTIFVLGSDENQRFTGGTATSFPSSFPPYVNLIYLNDTGEKIPPRTYHSSAKFMEPKPNCLVSLESQNTLKALCTYAVLHTDDLPHCSEPQPERFPGTVEYCARSNRRFVITLCAMVEFATGQPSMIMLATRTTKTIWPSQFEDVIQTSSLGRKFLFKFHKRSRIIFHTYTLQRVSFGLSTCNVAAASRRWKTTARRRCHFACKLYAIRQRNAV